MKVIHRKTKCKSKIPSRNPSLWLSCFSSLSSDESVWKDSLVPHSGNWAPFSWKPRKLGKWRVFCSILDIRKNTMSAKLIEQFRDEGFSGGIPASPQALSKARSYMNHRPFENMFYGMISWEMHGRFEEDSLDTVDGYLVVSIDGSIIQLPNLPEMRENYFQVNESPSALVSVAYDTMNNRCLAADWSDTRNEREAAKRLVKKLHELYQGIPMVLVFDRGYFSYELIDMLEDTGFKYCFRMKDNMVYSDDVRIGHNRVIEKGGKSIRVARFIIDSSSYEVEALGTNIFDPDWTNDDFRDLYHMRWGVEEEFKDLKRRLHLEAFTGKTENSLLQDFWATMLADLMLSVVETDLNEEISELKKESQNKYEYEVNRSVLVGIFRGSFYKIVMERNQEEQKKMLQEAMAYARRHIVPIIPGRSNERTRRIVSHHHNQKNNV